MKFSVPDRRRPATEEILEKKNRRAKHEHDQKMIAAKSAEARPLKAIIGPAISEDRSEEQVRHDYENDQLADKHDNHLHPRRKDPACRNEGFRNCRAPDQV